MYFVISTLLPNGKCTRIMLARESSYYFFLKNEFSFVQKENSQTTGNHNQATEQHAFNTSTISEQSPAMSLAFQFCCVFSV